MARNKTKKEGKTKYQLYLFAMNDENVKLASEYRFNRITRKYILVYTDKFINLLQNSRYHSINEKEIGHLSDAEKVWLLEANIKVIAEEATKDQEKMLREFEERIERLERELEVESDKLNREREESLNGE